MYDAAAEPMTETVVGVDVSVRRGLDVVVLDEALVVVDVQSALDPAGSAARSDGGSQKLWRLILHRAVDGNPVPHRDDVNGSCVTLA